MGFNLRKFLGLDFLEKKTEPIIVGSTFDQLSIRELAFDMCVSRIAKAFAKCEFRTYEKGKEVFSDIYYRLNVRPNANQNATQFWEKVIRQFYSMGHALIIPLRNGRDLELLCADDFSVDDTGAFREHKFSNITVNGMNFDSTYYASQVIYLKNMDASTIAYLDQTMSLYAKLVSQTYANYKQASGSKWKVHIGRSREADDDTNSIVLNEDMRAVVQNDNVVIPEYEGYEISKLDGTGASGTVSTREMKSLIDDIVEITCKALLIPTHIMTGEVTDTSKAVDDLLTFCLDSKVELISDELNGKLFDRSEYLNGTKIKINTQTIKHIDILDVSTSIDKLISCGFKSVNELLRVVGDEPIAEPWADEHFLTKNYSKMQDILTATTGENPIAEKGG